MTVCRTYNDNVQQEGVLFTFYFLPPCGFVGTTCQSDNQSPTKSSNPKPRGVLLYPLAVDNGIGYWWNKLLLLEQVFCRSRNLQENTLTFRGYKKGGMKRPGGTKRPGGSFYTPLLLNPWTLCPASSPSIKKF